MSSPTFLLIARIPSAITSPQKDEGYFAGNRNESSDMGCSEIISLVGVIIAFLFGIAGLINWNYKRRCVQRVDPAEDQETAVEIAHSESVNVLVSTTASEGHTVVMWTIPQHELAIPAPVVTSSGRVVEMGDLEEGGQGEFPAESRGFTLPERLQRRPWHRWFR